MGAVGGSRQVMSVFDHTASIKVRHGGTFNANPVTMTAGIETMKQMTPEAYSRLNALGDYLRERLARMFRDRGMPAQVCGRGSLFLAHLSGEELIDFRSLCGFSRNSPVYGELCHQMLQRGIILSPRGVFGCLSTPMSEGEADAFVNALESSLTKLTM